MPMIRALKDPTELRVISDDVLCSRVNGRLPRVNKGLHKTPSPIDDLDPGVDFALRPIDMLLELGAATTPPLPDDLRLSARWGLLRYGWALAAPTMPLSPLHLSAYAMNVKYHRKMLQSEDLGVGLACWLCGELLAARWPDATLLRVDGEAALDPAVRSLAVPSITKLPLATTGKMPDYFWVAYDGPSATIHEVVVLECKGTHTDDHVFTQLADAMHQLEAVTVAGATAKSIAFGAMLNDRRVRVYGVDPEGSTLAGPVHSRTRRRSTLEASIDEQGRLDITDPPRFRRRLLDVGAAQMLNWAGLSQPAAARLAGEPSADGVEEMALSVRETDAGVFVGVSSRLPVSSAKSYDVFFGLDREVAHALVADDEQAEGAAFADVRSRTAPWQERTAERLATALENTASPGDAPEERLPEEFPRDPPQRERRVGRRHLALDDAEDPNVVQAATPEGLFIEVRAYEGGATHATALSG
jgi:hypothetical protein